MFLQTFWSILICTKNNIYMYASNYISLKERHAVSLAVFCGIPLNHSVGKYSNHLCGSFQIMMEQNQNKGVAVGNRSLSLFSFLHTSFSQQGNTAWPLTLPLVFRNYNGNLEYTATFLVVSAVSLHKAYRSRRIPCHSWIWPNACY